MPHSRISRKSVLALASGCGLMALLTGCSWWNSEEAVHACSPTSTPLAQNVAANGFDDNDLLQWAQASQGSRLIPKSWFDALEQPGGGGRFADPDFLETFGLIGDSSLRYPVGLALDCQDDNELTNTGLTWYEGQSRKHRPGADASAEPWLGLNCAACHSGAVTIGDETHLVPGAPARFDYQSFVEALDETVGQTVSDPDGDRFARFADAVFSASGQEASEANLAQLRQAIAQWSDWQAEAERRNFPQGDARPRYGFSRVDAFGHIFNKMTMFAGAEDGNPSTAPVSYPFLWGIQQQNFVQWNGLVANAQLDNPLPVGNSDLIDYGALGRNTGEVLGVFGDLRVIERQGQRPSYDSSARVNNLMRLEELVGKLEAPKLSEYIALDSDASRVSAGRDLFGTHCQSCHLQGGALNEEGGTEVNVSFSEMQAEGNLTDLNMACNAFLYRSATARMAGTKTELVGGRELGDEEPVSLMLEVGVKGVMADNVPKLAEEVLRNLWGMEPRFDDILELPAVDDPNFLCRQMIDTPEGLKSLQYKARPLDGIWATAPYLHNGSVRTLYQLLLPPLERETSFWVGSTAYDAEEVGFRSAPDPDGGTTSLFDTSLSGNRSYGHRYGAGNLSAGTDMTEEEARQALLAYLRTL